MTNRYSHLLQPITLPNGVVLKNRMNAAASTNNFVQGTTAHWPTEEMITMMANRAKNGAAVVTLTGIAEDGNKRFYHRENDDQETPHGVRGDNYFTLFDLEDRKGWPKFVQLTEAVHMYKSKIILQLIPLGPDGYDVSDGFYPRFGAGDEERRQLTKEQLEEIKNTMVQWAKYAMWCGFDGVLVHMCYRFSVAARMLSRRTNKRTDEYGGSLDNRCRWPLEVCEAIKQACGREFIIEAVISGNDAEPDGWKIEDSVRFAELAEGKVDMIQVRHAEIDPSHPSGYSEKRYPMLEDAAAIKAAGVKIPIETIGGYNNVDVMEEVIATGKADIISSARCWISNPEFGKLVKEGRGEDIVPCIRCNKCHQRSMSYSKVVNVTCCSVNPKWGLEHRIDAMYPPADRQRDVAVVGGGPAGMKAALVAADRGHFVTIYEKTDSLGGLLNTLDDIDFKWPVTEYKKWLIRQVYQNPSIKVVLGTEASAALLRSKGHDAVLVGIGAEPVVPRIPGIELANSCIYALKHLDEVGQDVVIIGGGEIGVDCGMKLAQTGRNVTVIEKLPLLASTATIMHYYSHLVDAWSKLPTFHSAVNATTTEITRDGVSYLDENGTLHQVRATTVLYAVGVKGKRAEAAKLLDAAAYEGYLIGDCDGAGNLQALNRDAFGAASML